MPQFFSSSYFPTENTIDIVLSSIGTVAAGGRQGEAVQEAVIAKKTLFLLLLFLAIVPAYQALDSSHFPPLQPILTRWKRANGERTAFDLLRLEQQLDLVDPKMGRPLRDQPTGSKGGEVEADDLANALTEDECKQKCNEELRMGLDMVNAHSAFGSVGVPTVIDATDLQLFCRLDSNHDRCLIGCGYEVHFNMRDFVCKRRRNELISYLDCFANAAHQLKRQCGSVRCGPYAELEINLVGIGQRCRTLLCDLDCIKNVLSNEPRCKNRSRVASQYLFAYSQTQVSSWLRDLLGKNAPWQTWPRSCARLLCGNNGTNSMSNGNGGNGTTKSNCTLPIFA